MAREIERKFLVSGNAWRSGEHSENRQGYLTTDKERTVRVRIAGDRAYLTIKGVTRSATRSEFEYGILVDDAAELLDQLCLRPLIEKRSYIVEHEGMTWKVDEFFGDNRAWSWPRSNWKRNGSLSASRTGSATR